MRQIVWLAGCLLVLSCTINNDNLNADAGGTGGAGGCPRCAGTGGQTATGGQVGTGGAGGKAATGGQVGTGGAGGKTATGGHVGTGGAATGGGAGGCPRCVGTGGSSGAGGQVGTGGSATGGHGDGGSGTGGGGGQGGGKGCNALETDYGGALTAAKQCTLSGTDQCQQLVNDSLSCPGCKQYVNDATTLSTIQMAWDDQNCSSTPHACPAIACLVPTSSVCTSSPTAGGTGLGANPTGTCSPGPLTPAN